jgi:BarA-like signal transduction histidine kinase
MANRTLTADIIAAEALMIMENNLVMSNLVHRAEDEFDTVNGYRVGDTINFKKPAQFEIREGATAAPQDVVEGKMPLVVDTQAGVDFQFTSKELTLNVKDLSSRVIKPAMVRLANFVDSKLMNLYQQVPNWTGTAGQTINSFSDFSAGTLRLDDLAVPQDERAAVLSPADYWGLLGSQTGLYILEAAKGAYREGSLGKIGGVDTYMAQNVPSHTVGSDAGGTVGAAITAATLTYDSIKDTNVQTITTSSVSALPGDVFTIADVYEVNPVTKVSTGVLKQFAVVSYASNSAVITPALIWDGPFQNIYVGSVTDLNSKAITLVGTANTAYRQNMIFHKNAFALAMVPMEKPAGAVDVARKTYKGLSVRVIPYYDGTADVSNYRLDVLFGVKAIQPHLATRISGT